MIEATNIRFILTNTEPRIFRIPKNQCFSNTPSRCFNFSLTIEGHCNLNCLQGRVEKAGKKLQLKVNFKNYNKISNCKMNDIKREIKNKSRRRF